MLMSYCQSVNAELVLLNHVIIRPVLPRKFGDVWKVRIFAMCFS